MKSSVNDQTSFSQSPFQNHCVPLHNFPAFTASHCPLVEWYVATFYHLSPFEMRSAASGRWERQTKASSVLSSLKIWLLFKWGWKKDTGKGTPISKMETPSESAQHEQSLSELNLKRKGGILKQRCWTSAAPLCSSWLICTDRGCVKAGQSFRGRERTFAHFVWLYSRLLMSLLPSQKQREVLETVSA